MANDDNIDEKRFEAAVKVMRSLPENGPFEPSDDMLVMFYSYYKQATVGPCNTTKPNGWDSLGKAKWEAWKALGNMSKEQAMNEYVQEIKLILETMPVTEEVENLLDALDPFYEVVEDEDGDVSVAYKPATVPSGSADEASDEEEQEEEEEDKRSTSFEDDIEDELDLDNVEELNASLIDKMMGGTELQVCNGNTISPTNTSTHSSLNTEEEEEELICSEESSLELCPHIGQLSDGNEVSKQKPHSNESDSVVYMEPLKVKMGSGVPKACLAVSGLAGAKSPEEPGGNRAVQCESQDAKPQEAAPHPSDPPALGTIRPDSASLRRGKGCILLEAKPTQSIVLVTPSNCSGIEKCSESGSAADYRDVNKQITMALSRLQEDMKVVLQRLNVLETQTASQVTNPTSCSLDPLIPKKHSQWCRWDMSSSTMAFMIVWPFVVHWLVHLYRQKRKGRL